MLQAECQTPGTGEILQFFQFSAANFAVFLSKKQARVYRDTGSSGFVVTSGVFSVTGTGTSIKASRLAQRTGC